MNQSVSSSGAKGTLAQQGISRSENKRLNATPVFPHGMGCAIWHVFIIPSLFPLLANNDNKISLY